MSKNSLITNTELTWKTEMTSVTKSLKSLAFKRCKSEKGWISESPHSSLIFPHQLNSQRIFEYQVVLQHPNPKTPWKTASFSFLEGKGGVIESFFKTTPLLCKESLEA